MTITRQDIITAYNSIYSANNNNVLKTYEQLDEDEVLQSLLILLNNNGGSNSGGGGSISGNVTLNESIKLITTINLDSVGNNANLYTLDTSTRNSNCFLVDTSEAQINASIHLKGKSILSEPGNFLLHFSPDNFAITSDTLVSDSYYITTCNFPFFHISNVDISNNAGLIKVYEIPTEFANTFYFFGIYNQQASINQFLSSITNGRLPLLINGSIPTINYRPNVVSTPPVKSTLNIGDTITSRAGSAARTKILITNAGTNPVYVDVSPGVTTTSYGFILNPGDTMTDTFHTGLYYFRCATGLTTNVELREWQ